MKMYLVSGNVFEYIFSLGRKKNTSKDIRMNFMQKQLPETKLNGPERTGKLTRLISMH